MTSHPFPLFFFEHQTKSLDALGWRFDDPILDLMDQINQKNRVPIFRLEHKRVGATHFVGFIQVADQSIQILPKIYFRGDAESPTNSPEFADAVETASFNLMVMLSAVLNHPLKAKDVSALRTMKKNWLELMIRMFAVELYRQCQGGLEHQYISRQETLPYIKGRWLVEHSLARFALSPTQFDLVVDEFSPDTLLNRIFALTIQELIALTHDLTNSQLLHQLQNWFSEASPTPHSIALDFNRVSFTRLNERFLFAYQLARLFWERQILVLSDGKTRGISFLLDMNLLYERFLSWILGRYSAQIFPREWGITHIIFQSRGQIRYLGKELEINGDKPVFLIKPDVILFQNHRPFLVLDFKYKTATASDETHEVPQSDIYQVLAYTKALKVPRAVLMVPASQSFRTVRKFVFDDVEVRVIPVDLNQPLDQLDILVQELRHSFMA